MFILKLCGIIVLSYLLGSVSFSIIASNIMGKGDLREKGSGNAGLTNALRTGGKKVAALTLVGDTLKGIGAIYASKWIMSAEGTPNAVRWGMYAAAIAVVFGHIFPIFFRFRGGKGVLTTAAIVGVLDWRMFVTLMALFFLIFFVSGIVSLASISAASLLPAAAILFPDVGFPYKVLFFAVLAITVIISHRENIHRLFNGTEKTLFHKKGEKNE